MVFIFSCVQPSCKINSTTKFTTTHQDDDDYYDGLVDGGGESGSVLIV